MSNSQRIKCGYCDACFALHNTVDLQTHVEVNHPEEHFSCPDAIPVDIYSDVVWTEPDNHLEDDEVIVYRDEDPVDLWETASAWNSMQKTEDL